MRESVRGSAGLDWENAWKQFESQLVSMIKAPEFKKEKKKKNGLKTIWAKIFGKTLTHQLEERESAVGSLNMGR